MAHKISQKEITKIIPAELEHVVTSLVQYCGGMYIVGGAIRDWLLGRGIKDLDFAVEKNASLATKRIADHFHGSFFVLDEKRKTSRALITVNEQPLKIDFALLTSETIQEDLNQRDFTINAMAIDLAHPEVLIDPLRGEMDLDRKILRPCNNQSFFSDPIRTIRAVRFLVDFEMRLTAGAEKQIIAAIPFLKNISSERKRDELFRIFEIKDVARSLRLLRGFQMWPTLFPLVEELSRIESKPPHHQDGLNHSLSVLKYCQIFLNYLKKEENYAQNEFVRTGFALIDEYQQELREFFEKSINSERKYEGLLYLAAMYHDIGKTKIQAKIIEGKSIYYGHAKTSAEIFKKICPHWALSRNECLFIQNLIASHTLPDDLRDTESVDARKALHRFYKQFKEAGLVQSIFHMADILATYEEKLTQERWRRVLQTSRSLLVCWFEFFSDIVEPPIILNGDDLKKDFRLKAGKELGKILTKLQEAQAAGEVKNKKDAIRFVQKLMTNKKAGNHG